MFIPTHQYQGQRVRQEGSDFLLPNGAPLRGRGIKHADMVPLRTESRDLTPEQLGLALQAASPTPGNGMMVGYAVSARGDCATLIQPGRVRLSIAGRDGGSTHYLIDMPKAFTVTVLVLEEPPNA